MSYPQYPQYPQPPQQPPAGQAPRIGELPAGPVYVPIDFGDATGPWVQSQRAIQAAAGAEPLQLYIQQPDPTAVGRQYPRMMYNAKTRDMHVVKDDSEEKKYTGLGYSKDPFPAEAPAAK